MDSNQSWPDVVWGGEDARACVLVQLFFFWHSCPISFATAENAGTIVSSAAAPGGVAQGLGREKCISNINLDHF